MGERISLAELLERYNRERDPAEPPYRTWASVLAWAGDRLDDDIKDFLVRKGSIILRREGIPPGMELSPRLAASIRGGLGYVMTRRAFRAYLAQERGSRIPAAEDVVIDEHDDEREVVIYFDQYTDSADWMTVPASDVRALMSAAHLEIEPVRTRHDDIAAGRVRYQAPKVTLDELVERYRRKRDSAEPSLVTAASALAWAGDQLERQAARTLVDLAGTALSRDGIPPEIHLAPRTVAFIKATGDVSSPSDWSGLLAFPGFDLATLMPAGLVEADRVRVEEADRVRALLADVAAGRLNARALTADEYVESLATDTIWLSRDLIVYGGWIPVGIVAAVAGIIVALITSNWWLSLPIALGGTILGYLVANCAIIVFEVVDIGWLRLGRSEDAWFVILLTVGPAVVLLASVLVLSLA